ncbi:MAG: rRNA maturation RNase YbeY [Candidatus Omnitrophica bacterium]|nr:rRNA maturation RNase YbeY [Candidatus Omnitrophota bacterium]MCM8831162.1 rRNA maturation RNase YbeY [Candidatus Omnitrophota bacterium]
MKIEIKNQQKIKKLNLKILKAYIKKILKIIGISSKNISFLFCDNKFIRKINKKFFKKNYPTDVISFPLQDKLDPNYLGEVIVSVEQAIYASKKYKNSWEEEFLLYIVHGILHLLGFRDHTLKEQKNMEVEQNRIMKLLAKNQLKFR